MKKYIILTLLFPIWSHAHCPIEMVLAEGTFCTDPQWMNADKKVQGVLLPIMELSPYLIPQGEIPLRWLYSRVSFPIWLKGDSTHTPQRPTGWRVFPYMTMDNGHHHSASYQFTWDESSNAFILSGLALQSMKGCWSLRWTISTQDTLASSEKLIDVYNYTNLSDQENSVMGVYCKMESTSQADGSHEHEHEH